MCRFGGEIVPGEIGRRDRRTVGGGFGRGGGRTGLPRWKRICGGSEVSVGMIGGGAIVLMCRRRLLLWWCFVCACWIFV